MSYFRMWVSPVFMPLCTAGSEVDGDSVTHFKRDLIQYLSAYKRRQTNEWIDIIKQHDFSAAKLAKYIFILS